MVPIRAEVNSKLSFATQRIPVNRSLSRNLHIRRGNACPDAIRLQVSAIRHDEK
jgi:hypothetical protein